ncbi:MAG: hypothetical protein M3R55_06655 [Acidobacteriota bacterium]|nr:hypothetical protein [Acidobacteriota bacterium]
MSGLKLSKTRDAPGAALALAAVGLEAEFALIVDGVQMRPEDLFGDPRGFIRAPLVHRHGTSYHLPTGAAVYFDTGVIELATPIVELDRGCMARAGRSLWDSLHLVRDELDGWEARSGRRAQLSGFSAHYNVSADGSGRDAKRRLNGIAKLLTYILPAPVMLLAANRESTGVGVRPRGDRIEVTVDFTPSSSLMIAAGTLITGIVREVASWPRHTIDALAEHRIPVIEGFEPCAHTSRKGWLARFDCYPENPFAAAPGDALWPVRVDGRLTYWSMRRLARRVFTAFRKPIASIADPFSFRLIRSVLSGRAPSLLDLPLRPAAYEDVGRLCQWEDLFPAHVVAHSRYERVLMRALAGDRLSLGGESYVPTGIKGWSRIVFRRDVDGQTIVMPFDFLLDHLAQWEAR